MRTITRLAVAVAIAGITLPDLLSAQDELARRVAGAPDGTVLLLFPARAGVCGDGRTFIGEDAGAPDGFTIYSLEGTSFSTMTGTSLHPRCVPGPVRVALALRDHRVIDVRPYVGGDAKPDRPISTDLGTVAGAEAARYLLALARGADERSARNAMLAATLADGARVSPALAELARDRNLPAAARERALRWLPRAAEREGNRDAGQTVRTIAADGDDVLAVRERAIRVLGEEGRADAFLRDLYPRLGESSLRERVIRALGEAGTSENLAWIRGIALDDDQPTSLRERAIRVLGEEGGSARALRELYPRLGESALKERVIRAIGEEGSTDSRRWLRGIAENADESSTLRERAIRMLAETGEAGYLREIYPRIRETGLRERILRSLGEAGGAENDRFLRQVMASESEPSSLRERALRVASESGLSTAELGKLYDSMTDQQLRERVIQLLAERGDRIALDKLISIARTDADRDLRRRALRRLSESGDPRAKKAVEEAIER